MRTVEQTVYQFDELDERAKEAARDWYRDGSGSAEWGWYESVYDMADTAATLIGIEIDRKRGRTMGGSTVTSPAIYFSGFSSQGDGACFEGRYTYAKGSVTAIKAEFPTDTELHRIATRLQTVQRRNFYQLSARVDHRGHYYHEGCTAIDVFKDGDEYAARDEDTQEIKDCLRSFMQWIYSTLESEWDYLNSDEQVDESIRANEYEFSEDGERV